MYHFSDIIKNKFLDEIAAMSVEQLVTSLLLSCILCLFIVIIYRITYSGTLFSRGFAVSLVLLGMVTSLVILAVSTNVVLSLGMVGALSIVRFRTAVKDPMDTVFMFWAIAVGIVVGAGYVTVPVIATVLIGLLMVLSTFLGKRTGRSSWLVVLRCADGNRETEEKAASLLPRCRIRSRTLRDGALEVVYEVRLTERQMHEADAIRELPGVEEVSFLSSSGTTTL